MSHNHDEHSLLNHFTSRDVDHLPWVPDVPLAEIDVTRMARSLMRKLDRHGPAAGADAPSDAPLAEPAVTVTARRGSALRSAAAVAVATTLVAAIGVLWPGRTANPAGPDRPRGGSPTAIRAALSPTLSGKAVEAVVGRPVRLPVVAAARQPTPAVPPGCRTSARAAVASYVVVRGDNLSTIAQRVLGSSKRWPDLWVANRDAVRNPGRLRLGQVLLVPDSQSADAGGL